MPRASRPKTRTDYSRALGLRDRKRNLRRGSETARVPSRISDSLAGRYPDLARQWHPTKNPGVDPTKIFPYAYLRVWWRCSKARDHEWQAFVPVRVRSGSSCPFCSRRAASSTHNLAKRSPRLARLWHPTKNGSLTPRDVTPHATRRAWFRCPRGHEWQTLVTEVSKGSGCPYCSGRNATPETSLGTCHPRAAAYLHPTKNGGLGPGDLTRRSNRVVWWRCSKGPDHEWQEAVNGVVAKQESCPFCSNSRVSVTNSLASRFPRLAREWHPAKNGKLRPKDLVFGSGRRVWWQCPLGHVYLATPGDRRRGSGCPRCAGRRKRKIVTRRARTSGRQ